MKKGFWQGLLTGLIIAVFGVALYFGLKVLIDGNKDPKDKAKAQIEAEANARRENKTGGSVSEDASSVSDGSYVLEDEDVIKKTMDLQDVINELYIEDVSNEDIANGIYDGIMKSLDDPYAAYYTPEEFQEMQQDTEGIYFGIGCYLMKDQTYLYPRITGIMDNSPASESEIKVDDFITEVNGEDVYDQDLSDVVKKIKGPEGTTVNLTLVRKDSGEEINIDIERRKVETPTVKYEIIDDEIGYIKINEFDDITVDQFTDALATVKGSDVKGLIIDLRGNPGGSLAAVVNIAGQILPKGVVVYTEDKYGNRTDYNSEGKTPLEIPLVVLVNGNSASASEILAGAVKDYEIGTIMGTTTYGKGIVQRVLSLQDGSAVKLTVSHYYTPNGNDIHKVGIEPDVVVELDVDAYLEDENNDNQKEEAIKYIKDQID